MAKFDMAKFEEEMLAILHPPPKPLSGAPGAFQQFLAKRRRGRGNGKGERGFSPGQRVNR